MTPEPITSAEEHERAASVIEYALLVALIAVVCVTAMEFLGGTVSSTYSSSGSQLFPPG